MSGQSFTRIGIDPSCLYFPVRRIGNNMVEGLRLQILSFLEEVTVNEGNLFFHFILVNIFLSLRTILNFNSGYLEGRFSMNHNQGNDAAACADI